MIESIVKDITIEYLQDTEIGENLKKAMSVMQNAQETAYAYVSDDNPEQLKQIRIGTLLVLSVLNKVFSGKPVQEFDNDDWKEIATAVSDNAIRIDPSEYSVRVFTTYANYVDISVKVLKAMEIPDKKCDAISAIAQNVRDLSTEFKNGKISEVDYTEKSLWLMLEAMIKLLATYSSRFIGNDASEFAQSVAMYAFEYGRYTLYRQEQEILTLYIERQQEIDDELEKKLSEYQKEMQKRQEEFHSFIDGAFDKDIASRLKSTVQIAKSSGVNESEILDSVQKVDDFFM